MKKEMFRKLEKSLTQAIESERKKCRKTVEQRELEGKKIEVKRVNEDCLE